LYLHLQNGESALHAAALFGHTKVVKELIQAGAKVDLKNKVSFYVKQGWCGSA